MNVVRSVVIAAEESVSGDGFVPLMTSRSMDLSTLNIGASSSPQRHSSRHQYVTQLGK